MTRWLRHPVVLLLVVAAWIWAVDWANRPPEALPEWVEDDRWSAGRAELLLVDLLAENEPHPSGSATNVRVRDRIVANLESWGYPVEVQTAWHCNPGYGSCGQVDNIIAVRNGSEGRNAVLLTAHYDSGLAGPGAADDGAGTAAVLETARMLATAEDLRNDVIILITDGEERGLIGADLFASDHPLFGKVRAVINLEARGVTGPSAMFETGEGNRRVIREFSDAVARPVANSLTYEIYRRMPNDTDFSVYRRLGANGVNFAFAGGVAAYHSVRDDMENLDRGSLQHHGDNAWAMVQALGGYNLDRITAEEDAAYIDFLGRVLWHYPVSISGGVAVFLSVLVLLGILAWSRGELRIKPLFWSLLAVTIAVTALFLGAWSLSWPLGRWIDMHPLEHPSPWVGRITLYLMAVLAIWLTNRLTAGRKSPHAMTLVCWAAFSGGGLWTAYHFPAASYLFLIPLFAFLCGLVIDVLRRRARPGMLFSRWLGFALAAYMGVYHFQMLEVVANFQLSLIKVAPLILPLVAILPLLVRTGDATTGWAPARLVGGLIVLGCLAQQFVPGYSIDRPRDMALLYMEFVGEFDGESAGGRESYLALESFSGDADGDFAGAHGFAAMDLPWINGTTRRMPARPMPGLGLPGASLRYVGITPHEEGGLWRHSLELKPPPGAQDVRLLFGAAPAELQGDGPGIGTGIGQIRVDGMLAWDDRTGRKSDIAAGMVNLAYPGTATRRIEILAASPDELGLTTSSRLPLPPSLLAPLEPFWPEDAEPAFLGHRAEVTAGLTGLEPEQ